MENPLPDADAHSDQRYRGRDPVVEVSEPDGDQKILFVCQSPLGMITWATRFRAGANRPRNLVQTLLVSALFEPLLQELESRLACELDLQPVPVGTFHDATSASAEGRRQLLHLTCALPNNAMLEDVTVALPIDALPLLQKMRMLEQWPETLDVRFQPLDARLQISQAEPDATDRQKLSPGAVVLLPESFSGQWRARLSFSHSTLCLNGFIDRQAERWLMTDHHTNGHDNPETVAGWRLSHRMTVHPEALLRSVGTAGMTLPRDWTQLPWTLDTSDGQTGVGRLLPVAQGFGWLMQSVDAPPAGQRQSATDTDMSATTPGLPAWT